MPLRVWDTFVVPIDNFAMGDALRDRERRQRGRGRGRRARQHAASRGSVFEHADERGRGADLVSSDINSANHNYPTNYNEAIYVAGSLPDTAPYGTCDGPGSLPGIGDVISPPEEFTEGCEELLGLLDDVRRRRPRPLQPITTSFFRNSNLTQYGGKADIVLMGSTGSENTGQASGAAGLLASFGREEFGAANPLSGNEIRQLLTMTAEDVLPANTGVIGAARQGEPGLGPALRLRPRQPRRGDGADRRRPGARRRRRSTRPTGSRRSTSTACRRAGLPVTGHAAAPHSSAGVGAWELEYACGQDAPDSAFAPVPGASGTGAGRRRAARRRCPRRCSQTSPRPATARWSNDAGRPAGGLADGAWPADPYPNPDPERHAFQIRLTVHEAGDPQNFGRYRKTLFAYDDDGNLPGWPRPVGAGSAAGDLVTGSGGEVPPRLFDLDGDNALDVIQPTTSGELSVLRSDGTPLPSFNGGAAGEDRAASRSPQAHPPPGSVPAPRESLRAPAIGDIDGDLEPDIVAAAGEHVYAWDRHGDPLAGFPVRIDPALSEPCVAGRPEAVLRRRPTARSPPRTTSSAASSARRRSPTSTATAGSTSSPARWTSTSTPGTATATRCPASR